MKGKFVLLIFVCLLLFLFFGCSSNNKGQESTPDQNEGTNEEIIMLSSARKIIYHASANLYIEDNFQEKVDTLIDSINDDEWTDYVNISQYSAQITFRIKTERLDEFIDSLSTYGEVKKLNKQATDISLQYQDTSNQILALEAEKDRLIELYDEASMSEIILINTRISEIDKELRILNGEIVLYDSLIDYSEVEVSIYNETPEEDELSYGQKLKRSFNMGIRAFVRFFEFLSLVIVTIFPFVLVLAVAGVGIYYLTKWYSNRKKAKLKKLRDNPEEKL